MQNILLLQLLILLLQPFRLSAYNMEPVDEIQSELLTLYEESTPLSDITAEFVKTLNHAFDDEPEFIFGISGYKGSDGLLNELFLSYWDEITTTSFKIIVQVSGATKIILFEIRYLAIEDQYDAFSMQQYYSDSFDNTSAGTGHREDFFTIFTSYQIATEAEIAVFLNGYWIRGVSGFGYQIGIDGDIVNQTTLLITVIADQSTTIEKIQIVYIIINSEAFQPYHQIKVFTDRISFNTSTTSSQYVQFSSTSNFLLGIVSSHHSAVNGIIINFRTPLGTGALANHIQYQNPNAFTNQFSQVLIGFAYCDEDLFWYPTAGNCIENCNAGYTSDPDNGICELCSDNCKSCSLDPQFCTQCSEEKQLQEQSGRCTKINLKYLLLLLLIIPLILILVFCYYRFTKRRRRIHNGSIKEQPSIQL